jgi:hypothetical protein
MTQRMPLRGGIDMSFPAPASGASCARKIGLVRRSIIVFTGRRWKGLFRSTPVFPWCLRART